MALPNFIVIGAPKAGTTSLYAYLRSHPDVFMPERKELDFFVAEHNWKHGQRWYERWFEDAPDSVTAIGEASPRYTMYPAYGGVPARIAQVLPEAKLIYVVRDPIERMVSHYQQIGRRGGVHANAAEALLSEQHLLDSSRYGMQLERYLEYFAREQILVVVTERLRHQRRRTIEQIFTFLGLDPSRPADHFREEHNATAGQQAPRPFMRPLMGLPGWSRLAYSMPAGVKAAGRRFTHRPESRMSLTPEVRRELEDRLREDVAMLRSYMATPDFDGWGIG